MKKLASAVCWEGEKVRGSRFIAHLIPISARSDVSYQLKILWEKYPKAARICYAWRLTQGNSLYCDDGEPKGSAGQPILRHLEGAQVVHVLGAVVRFYGGTKLGVGGLIRAYGGAVSQALAMAKTEEYVLRKTIKIESSYNQYKNLISLCERHEVKILEVDFHEKISVTAGIPLNSMEFFLSELHSYKGVTYSLEK